MSVIDDMIGTVVLVRDNQAGVHVGTLASADMNEGTCEMRDARKIWHWSGAGSVHGIAAHGLDRAGSKVAAKVAAVATRDVVEIVQMSDKGCESVMGAPEWMP